MCGDCGVRFLIFGIPTIVFLIIACGTIGGYVVNANANNRSSNSTCVVETTYVVKDRCAYDCNCDTDGCETCHKDCYTGMMTSYVPPVEAHSYVTLCYNFLFFLTKHRYPLRVFGYYDTYNQADITLNRTFPVHKQFLCYFDRADLKDGMINIRLSPYEESSIFIASMVFFGLSGIELIVWLVVECCVWGRDFVNELYECCFRCCSRCRDRIRQRKKEKQQRREQELEDIEHANDQRQSQLRLHEQQVQQTMEDISALSNIPPHLRQSNLSEVPSAPPAPPHIADQELYQK